MGLITPNQMMKGFGRVAECMDDLVLDVPDVEKQFKFNVERAKKEGWIDSCFPAERPAATVENGFASKAQSWKISETMTW